jgi:hypothetical protein
VELKSLECYYPIEGRLGGVHYFFATGQKRPAHMKTALTGAQARREIGKLLGVQAATIKLQCKGKTVDEEV